MVAAAAIAPELLAFVILGLLLAYLIASTVAYQLAQQGHDWAINLPAVGDTLAAFWNTVKGWVVSSTDWVSDQINDQTIASLRAFSVMVRFTWLSMAAPLLQTIHNAAAQAQAALDLANAIATVDLPGLRASINDIDNLSGRFGQALRALVALAITTALVAVDQQLAALQSEQKTQAGTIATYRPLWNSLAAVPGGAATTINADHAQVAVLRAQVATLERELTDTRAGVSALQQQIAQQQALLNRLAALGVIAAAGAAVIANVVRLGRDPCYCLTQGAFNDLPARVDSLELANL